VDGREYDQKLNSLLKVGHGPPTESEDTFSIAV
jgi:hypothetical protein